MEPDFSEKVRSFTKNNDKETESQKQAKSKKSDSSYNFDENLRKAQNNLLADGMRASMNSMGSDRTANF